MLLFQVLNGKEAADILAHHVHREINCGIKVKPSCIPDYPMDDLGIWIDPIGKIFYLTQLVRSFAK